MRRAAALSALFVGAGAVELSAVSLSRNSLPQVVEVLEQVRSTAREAARRAERAGAEAEANCVEALRSSDQHAAVANLVKTRLRSDIEEQDAAVEEATGSTQQVRANIDLIQHTLVQIKKNGHFTPAMADNKLRTLDSLQGELRIMLPAFAQLRSRSAEAVRRLDDHTRSWDAAASLWKAMRQVCLLTSQRSADLASRSASQQSAMDEVLKALKPLAGAQGTASAQPAMPELTDEDSTSDEDDSAPSFVQVAQHHDQDDDANSDQDLVSMFGSEGDSAQETDSTKADATVEQQVSEQQGSEQQGSEQQGSEQQGAYLDLMPKVKQLLAEVRSEGEPAAVDSKKWCKLERSKATLSLRAVSAAVRELRAEALAHSEAAAQADEDLARINGTVTLIQGATSRVSDSVDAEQKAASTASKDEKLAAKILSQAAAVLSESTSLRGTAGQSVISSVQAAAAAFSPDRSSASALVQFRDDFQSMMDLAKQSLSEFAVERSHLELSRDSHASLRDRTLESKGLYDAQMTSTQEYLQKLDERCKGGTSSPVERERAAEIRALSDAQAALSGQALEAPPAPAASETQSSLRGGSAAVAPSARSLSPLERAAAEMGVDTSSV